MKSKTLLGLRDKVTLKEIKHNYKSLMKKWHPDKHPNKEQATNMSAQINEAYRVIMDYIENYEYSFEEEIVKKKTLTPQEWWHERFSTK
jgi:DnaJ-class molecular chaperone